MILFTVCYQTEFNRKLIWIQAKENTRINQFYEKTVQNIVPIALVSDTCSLSTKTPTGLADTFTSEGGQSSGHNLAG